MNFECQIDNIISHNKLSHSYIIEVSNYEFDYDLILKFVKLILCNSKDKKISNIDCNKCNICKLIDTNNYPDLKVISTTGNWIKKEQIIDLQSDFSNKSLLNNKRIYIIKEADRLNISAANTLLKFLEEPEDNIIAILVTENRYKLISTLLSRCQILKIKNSATSNEYVLDNLDNELIKLILEKKIFVNYNYIFNEIFINKEQTIERLNKINNTFINYLKGDYVNENFDSYSKNQIIKLINIIQIEQKKLEFNVNYKIWIDNFFSRIMLEV